MATTIGRVALSGICAGIALYVALRADNEKVQTAAALASSGLFGFTTTTLVLKQHRERKSRELNTDTYLEMLRQVNTPRSHTPQQPRACQGCCHYHGRIYGGNMLVCAMHPFGVEGDRCGDWESKATEEPHFDSDVSFEINTNEINANEIRANQINHQISTDTDTNADSSTDF